MKGIVVLRKNLKAANADLFDLLCSLPASAEETQMVEQIKARVEACLLLTKCVDDED